MNAKTFTIMAGVFVLQSFSANFANAEDKNIQTYEAEGLRPQAVKDCLNKNAGDRCSELGLPGRCRADKSCDTSGASSLQIPGPTIQSK